MAWAQFPNTNLRDRARNDVAAELATRQTWATPVLHVYADGETEAPSLYVEARVTAEPDMHAMFQRAQEVMDSRGWVSGWITWHPCDHDEAARTGCTLGGERVR